MKITDTIKYVGVNDHRIDLFEGQYKVPGGMSYNSYVILDEKIAVMDTVDADFTHQWLDNIQQVLDGRKPDYLIVQHMEPDHAANVANFLKVYPDTTVVATGKAFGMIRNFFELDLEGKKIEAENGSTLSLGYHQLTFVFAPMVHWPEVMVTYDSTEKVLFSADGFGKFGALDVEEPWDDEARRYFIGIVGKYGEQVQKLLKAAATLDIQKICPLHGPVLTEDLGHYIGLYDTWSSYTPEDDGIVIAYTSVYGHTRMAVSLLAEKLKAKGCPRVLVYDLARDDMSQALSDAFRYSKLILATTTYNAGIYPFMNDFITRLVEHNYQNRTVGLIENGSWAPLAAKIMKEMMSKCKKIDWLKNSVHIWSAVKEENRKQIDDMTDELCKEYIAKDDTLANKNDMTALFRIGYGLYVVTSNDGRKDNGLIVNTVTQLTDNPYRVAVNINKANYSHHVIRQTGVLNVNCLSIDAPFSVFQQFGFQSGRTVDKFAGQKINRSGNGLVFLDKYINAFMSLKVEQYVDLDTHGMFICSVTEARVMSDQDTMTYTYYQQNVKPKPETEGKKGFVCKVCGYVYEGDELPEDIICPLCKHGAVDFEPIQ
ncbi:flavin reductase [Blautia sp. 2744]|jgi:flavorubredoxin/flavin reductase (DIM6/NTAB) family NADH-FMN oxidoreductase RutF|uniref:Flavin reductase n=1 Tax=Blautia intestinalis TaxID=2763028 RepID=A0ABR7I2G0_9FIRM|nr:MULTISPECIES: flavin reductase [Blautia]MBC5740683.1 flavin reductase [Blautia intestinalis]RHA48239.1 MBL fold metallo-hydrolase [Blautia obeum]RHD33962.1 MBL fold metallo-hydrolase [Blautia obeum]